MSTLERLNYVPGQRLGAADLKLEADYFINVRRLLNQGLFAPGVLNGLEVTKTKDKVREVTVNPGLALDPQGREMYVPAAVPMTIPACPPTTSLGYCLVIRYNEVPIAPQANGCGVPTGTPADTRIDEQPLLEFTQTWPNPARCAGTSACSPAAADCAVVLAMVTMDSACNVKDIVTGVRQYAYPRNVTQVQALSFTGEKDIDSNNSKRLYFHCRNGTPNAAWLYLRGDRFSTLNYTELGSHVHSLKDATTGPETAQISIAHTHDLNPIPTVEDPSSSTIHRHKVYDDAAGDYQKGVHMLHIFDHGNTIYDDGYQPPGGELQPMIEPTPVPHEHCVPSQTSLQSSVLDAAGHTVPFTTTLPHEHNLAATAATDATGATDPTGGTASDARPGSMLTYLNDMKVCLDGTLDITPLLLSQINDPAWKNQLGDGTATHPINMVGTGGIDLYRLTGVTPADGEHCLEFTVGPGEGGKVMWELYIE